MERVNGLEAFGGMADHLQAIFTLCLDSNLQIFHSNDQLFWPSGDGTDNDPAKQYAKVSCDTIWGFGSLGAGFHGKRRYMGRRYGCTCPVRAISDGLHKVLISSQKYVWEVGDVALHDLSA